MTRLLAIVGAFGLCLVLMGQAGDRWPTLTSSEVVLLYATIDDATWSGGNCSITSSESLRPVDAPECNIEIPAGRSFQMNRLWVNVIDFDETDTNCGCDLEVEIDGVASTTYTRSISDGAGTGDITADGVSVEIAGSEVVAAGSTINFSINDNAAVCSVGPCVCGFCETAGNGIFTIRLFGVIQ